MSAFAWVEGQYADAVAAFCLRNIWCCVLPITSLIKGEWNRWKEQLMNILYTDYRDLMCSTCGQCYSEFFLKTFILLPMEVAFACGGIRRLWCRSAVSSTRLLWCVMALVYELIWKGSVNSSPFAIYMKCARYDFYLVVLAHFPNTKRWKLLSSGWARSERGRFPHGKRIYKNNSWDGRGDSLGFLAYFLLKTQAFRNSLAVSPPYFSKVGSAAAASS